LFFSLICSEAQTRLVNYLSSNRLLARANSDLSVRVRECLRTQKILEFRSQHLTKLMAVKSRDEKEIEQQENFSTTRNFRSSLEKLELEKISLEAKLKISRDEFEKLKLEIDQKNSPPPIFSTEENLEAMENLRRAMENLHTESEKSAGDEEKLKQELEAMKKQMAESEQRARDGQQKISALEVKTVFIDNKKTK